MGFGGRTERCTDDAGRYRVRWIPAQQVKGVAYDTPVLGYRVNTCNTLRLWKSEAVESFDFQDFNVGDYYGAVHEKVISETLSKVLYPNDEPEIGKRLRLAQQYFFVSCSLQDMLRLLDLKGEPIARFPRPVRGAAERHPPLDRGRRADAAAGRRATAAVGARPGTSRGARSPTRTTRCCPRRSRPGGCRCSRSLLPRPLEIIYEINRRFLDEVRQRYPGDDARVARLSLIDEAGEQARAHGEPGHRRQPRRQRRRGAALELLQADRAARLRRAVAGTFRNVTNGVTPRRFVVLSNPALARAARRDDGRRLGHRPRRGSRRSRRTPTTPAFQERWRAVKRPTRSALAQRIRERTGVVVDPDALFDIQVKRIHEYKRQHLNVLHIITLYQRLRANPQLAIAPRCFVFGGKAAPGYLMAKLIIRLINGVAEVVNADPAVARTAEGRVLPGLQRQERARSSTRPPTCPSRSRPPARRPRARAT